MPVSLPGKARRPAQLQLAPLASPVSCSLNATLKVADQQFCAFEEAREKPRAESAVVTV